MSEQIIRWRGSATDLATDIAALPVRPAEVIVALLARMAEQPSFARERETEDTVAAALEVIERWGDSDGADHKAWVIDQVARALTGDGYDAWVIEMRAGEDGPHTYDWDTGIAP